jgi:4,4'-diaponeurosporenoate glycosyltransferase
MFVDWIVHCILWLFGFIFFYHFPLCRKKQTVKTARPALSIIIPARNEETNIPNLLRSLIGQLEKYDEVLVVDDHSNDNTATVAVQEGAKVIKSEEMPWGWTGKTWACYQGAQSATNTLLIFLDADTIIEDSGLDSISGCYNELQGVLSIQPYHRMYKLYEQLSAFFNLILIAAMGSFTIFGKASKPIGLFGPVIVIEKNLYLTSGGFEKVKGEIVEDLAFGAELKKQGINLHCYRGRGTVSFRMYPGSISHLITGWSKGFAMGAVKTSVPVLIMIIAWIVGALGTTRNLIQTTIILDISTATLWGLLYIAYAIQLYWMLRKIGNFKPYTAILFPIPLLFFIIVFFYSFFIIFIRRSVNWKGRTLEMKSRAKHADTSSDSDYHTD